MKTTPRTFGSGTREQVIEDYCWAVKQAVQRASLNGTWVITEMVQIVMEQQGRIREE